MAKVTFVPGSGTLAAYLSGEIDHHAAQTLRREIDAQVDDRLEEAIAWLMKAKEELGEK